MRVHMICQKHRETALVGPGTLLDELECPACIAEEDAANEWRPCCPQMNTTCVGHDWDYLEEPTTKWPGVIIESANFSNMHRLSLDDADVPF